MSMDISPKRSVIMLISNRTKEADIVQGLQLGADDYLKKPFGLQEFLARIAVLARRSPAPPSNFGLRVAYDRSNSEGSAI